MSAEFTEKTMDFYLRLLRCLPLGLSAEGHVPDWLADLVPNPSGTLA